MAIESRFQSNLKAKIKDEIPDALIIKTPSNAYQGIPDLCIMANGKCAFVECKGSETAKHQPNQDVWIEWLNAEGFYATFAYPRNAKNVVESLRQYFGKGEDATC